MAIKIWAADKHFGAVVKALAGNQCEHCGVGDEKQLQCCHLIGRRSASTRWYLPNAVCMCSNCHREMGEHPKLFTQWIEERWPGRWQLCYDKHNAPGLPAKNTGAHRDRVSAHYREQLKRLTAEPDFEVQSWL